MNPTSFLPFIKDLSIHFPPIRRLLDSLEDSWECTHGPTLDLLIDIGLRHCSLFHGIIQLAPNTLKRDNEELFRIAQEMNDTDQSYFLESIDCFEVKNTELSEKISEWIRGNPNAMRELEKFEEDFSKISEGFKSFENDLMEDYNSDEEEYNSPKIKLLEEALKSNDLILEANKEEYSGFKIRLEEAKKLGFHFTDILLEFENIDPTRPDSTKIAKLHIRLTELELKLNKQIRKASTLNLERLYNLMLEDLDQAESIFSNSNSEKLYELASKIRGATPEILDSETDLMKLYSQLILFTV